MTIGAAFYGRLVQVFGLDGTFGSTPAPVRIPMSDAFVIEPTTGFQGDRTYQITIPADTEVADLAGGTFTFATDLVIELNPEAA